MILIDRSDRLGANQYGAAVNGSVQWRLACQFRQGNLAVVSTTLGLIKDDRWKGRTYIADLRPDATSLLAILYTSVVLRFAR